MGSFVNYMYEFVKECNQANGIMTQKTISKWFGNKKAVKRDSFEYYLIGKRKIAVVVVAVSGIGKSTYVQNFLKQVSDFECISYDEAYYQKYDEQQAGIKVSEYRTVEIIEEQILKVQDKNIIVDSMCIHPTSRAALFRFLSDLDYEIHMIYFSRKYTEDNIKQRMTARAIELALYQDYLARNNISRMKMVDLMKIRNNIIEIYARKKRITAEELKAQTVMLPTTITNMISLINFYNNEIETNRVWWQENRGLFMLGADYYYEL